MQMLNKRDVVKEVMRARRLAQGMYDPAVIESLKDYAREVERKWREQVDAESLNSVW
jgi:hypothetical protein